MRTCRVCEISKPLVEFRKAPDCSEGRSHKCKLCYKEAAMVYEKSEKGYLMRAYVNMRSRINGIQKSKHHLYKGKSLLTKQEFYAWVKSSNFLDLFKIYVSSDYDMKLAPSVDRIDSGLGYEIGNIRWITHSENSSLGGINRHRTTK